MMNKSVKIIILIIIVLVFFLVGLYFVNKYIILPGKAASNNAIGMETEAGFDKEALNNELYYVYNPDQSCYDIYDMKDEYITSVYNKLDLKFYKDNPDYRPSKNDVYDDSEVEPQDFHADY